MTFQKDAEILIENRYTLDAFTVELLQFINTHADRVQEEYITRAASELENTIGIGIKPSLGHTALYGFLIISTE